MTQNNPSLRVQAAQWSDKGPKAVNDDALALHLPDGFARSARMAIAVIADGVSASEHGGEAAVIATRSFCDDFLATDPNWSIKTAGYRVIAAINRWLHGQGQHYHLQDNTHLTTFSAVVIEGQMAHVFHVGDSRVWRFRPAAGVDALECLTKDHSIQVGKYTQLIRALGMDWQVDVDYLQVDLQVGDYLLLTTDGVHGVLNPSVTSEVLQALEAERQQLLAEPNIDTNSPQRTPLECAVYRLGQLAAEAGSDDNQSCQLVYIEQLALSDQAPDPTHFPPLLPDHLLPGQIVDGYAIVAELHANSRSKIYRAIRQSDQLSVVLKSPAPQFSDDLEALQAFVQEDWIGQRINHPDIVKTYPPDQPRRFLYLVQEYLSGQSLREWRRANPDAPVETVIRFARPAVRALRALHRRETLHQDVKPDNLFVVKGKDGREDQLRLIDFGSAQVGSIQTQRIRPGAMEYAAPEYALHKPVDARADQFALAMTLYEMLTGEMPYGEDYVSANSEKDFARLSYIPASSVNPHVPPWMDAALMKACRLDPDDRYQDLGEWLADLERPNLTLTRPKIPISEKHPVLFWQSVALILFVGHLLWLAAWFKHL